jgi:hypothetical protein
MTAMMKLPDDHPLIVAWNAYQQTEDFDNSHKWMMHPDRQHQLGSLWAIFMAGWNAATERARSLHESVNPASDDERQSNTPGAGAMGAVIEYRDLISKS